MKTISHKGLLHILYNKKGYKVKTPLGVFFDINDALEVYPTLKNISRVKECSYCKKVFVDVSTKNNRKYCSKECTDEYRKIYKNEYQRMLMRDKKLRDTNQKILEDAFNNTIDPEFHQDDRFWGLGESNLKEHRNNDIKKEAALIKKELKRLNNRWNNDYLN